MMGKLTRRENHMEFGPDKVLASRVAGLIHVVPDFPLPKIRFRDITSIVEGDPPLFRAIIDRMVEMHQAHPPDCIVCIEAWGYVFGVPMAYLLGSRICLARRPGKLPRRTIKQGYDMCYAHGRTLEVHHDAIKAADKVLVVDDIVASGGSALAAVNLVEQLGATCIGITYLAAFVDGPFTNHIEEKGIPIRAISRL
jgi:adenine phosphoribosyltransferase